jgi:hypothetical protein
MKFPKNFIDTHKAEGHIIDRSNFREFVKNKNDTKTRRKNKKQNCKN